VRVHVRRSIRGGSMLCVRMWVVGGPGLRGGVWEDVDVSGLGAAGKKKKDAPYHLSARDAGVVVGLAVSDHI